MYLWDNAPSYIWKKDWIISYESLWGIIEKFKYINCLESLNTKVFNLKVGSALMRDEYNYTFRNNIIYTPQELSKKFGIFQYHYDYLKPFKNNKIEEYMDTKLKVCPVCIKYGYHSFIHQFAFERKCFIHQDTNLIRTEQNYYIQNNKRTAYEFLKSENIEVLSSDEMLTKIIYDKTFLNQSVSKAANIKKYNILQLNNTENNIYFNDFMTNEMKEFIHDSYWGLHQKHKEPVFVIKKEYGNEIWEDINYTDSEDSLSVSVPKSKFGWLSNYAYSFIENMLNTIDKYKLKKTASELRNSYIEKYYADFELEKYDYDSIAVLITMAIISGNTTPNHIGDIYYTFHPRNRTRSYLFYQIQNRINEAELNSYRVIYIELFKCLLNYIYQSVKEKAYKDEYTGLCNTEIVCEIKYPIFLTVEDNEKIFLYMFN